MYKFIAGHNLINDKLCLGEAQLNVLSTYTGNDSAKNAFNSILIL